MKNWVKINSDGVLVDGKRLDVEACEPGDLLHAIYKKYIGNYPKFHKMDSLCKLGFVASELLLDAEGCREEARGDSRGVVLFNSTSSLADDSNYQKTIEGEDCFPSPSLFVYTLPNVVTGEISIRNKFYGESNFMVLPQLDACLMARIIAATFSDPSTTSLVTGWVDCSNEEDFSAFVFLVEKADAENVEKLAQEINKITQ